MGDGGGKTHLQSVRGEAFVELVRKEEFHVAKIDLLGIECIATQHEIMEVEAL
jgi:hypothetical protein